MKVTIGLLSSCFALMAAAPITVKVALPAGLARSSGNVVLHIENLKLPPHASGIVRVFADLPGATAATPTEDQHFVGYFTVLPKNSREAAAGAQQATTRLDLGHKKQLLSGKKAVNLTLVAVSGAGGSVAAEPSAKPTFSRIYLAQE